MLPRSSDFAAPNAANTFSAIRQECPLRRRAALVKRSRLFVYNDRTMSPNQIRTTKLPAVVLLVHVAFSISLATVVFAQPTFADCPFQVNEPESLRGINGAVSAMTFWDPDAAGPAGPVLIAGGEFSCAGRSQVKNIAAWNGVSWSPFGTNGNSTLAFTMFNGNLIAAGYPTGASGNCVNRWNGTAWQLLGSITGVGMFRVRALAVYNGQLVAGGDFSNVSGSPANNIAIWNGTSWKPIGAGLNGSVTALAVYQGELVAGGSFTASGSVNVSRISRWDGSSWQPLGTGVTGPVKSLCEFNGDLVVGGGFTFAGNVQRPGIARWNGSEWLSLGASPGLGLDVNVLLRVDNRLFAAGSFEMRVAAWDGVAWTQVGSPSGSGTAIDALASSTAGLFVGGQFARLGTEPAYNVGAWDGSAWRALPPDGFDQQVTAVSIYNGALVAGGDFTVAGGSMVGQIAQKVAGVWQPIGSGLNGTVRAISEYDGELIAAGTFTAAGSLPVNRIARWNGSAWRPLGAGLNGAVRALAVFQNELIAGGSFTTAGGSAAKFIARWNGDGWAPVGSGFDSTVASLLVFEGDLVAGGSFSSTGDGAMAKSVARWNGTLWQSVGNQLSGTSTSLANCNGLLIAGGTISSFSPVQISSMARWNGTRWDDMGSGIVQVNSLAVYNHQLVVGGQFNQLGSLHAAGIARWDGESWKTIGAGLSVSPISPGIPPIVNALVVRGGELIAAGSFLSFGSTISPNVATLESPATPLEFLQQPSSRILIQGDWTSFSALASESVSVTYRWRRNRSNLYDDPGHIAGTNTTTLWVFSAIPSDAGLYDCVVSNDCGSATSSAAQLTVLGSVPTGPIRPFAPVQAIPD